MHPHDSEALGSTLQRANEALKSALGEACGVDIDRADTGELIRVEEVLAIANEAAKEAISVRRRLSTERAPDQSTSAVQTVQASSREIEDEQGVRWAAFEVHPTTSTDRISVRERFRDGWLAFDSGLETRRVAPIPGDWQELEDERLLEVLRAAESVPRRSGRRSNRLAMPPETSPLPLEGPG